MEEQELIAKIYEVLEANPIEGTDRVKFNGKDEVRVEFHDGGKPKRLRITTDQIGLDYGGDFVHKNYRTNPMSS